jgi:predicted dehydrogenase
MKDEKSNKMKRREFLGKASISALGFTIVPRFVLGKGYVAPSDRITLGVIGCGRQSQGLMSNFLKMDTTQVVAVCDVDTQKLKNFHDYVTANYAGRAGKGAYEGIATFTDYKALIARKDIDAIVIITPDHWHAIMSIESMMAGKDVYCEKPLSHSVAEGRAMVKATEKYGKILQTGSMQRSWQRFRHACELVANGYIGEVKSVKVNVGDPALVCDLPAETTPDYLNWDAWLGPAPARPFNAILSPPYTDKGWPKWRNYQEYGGGILSDWGAHMFDIAQWGLGMDHSGPVSFEPPQDRNAKRGLIMQYANGITMTHEDFGRGWAVQFNGTEGTLEVSRDFLDTKPEKIKDEVIGDNQKRLYASNNHYQDWLDAIKSRKQPICPAEVGHRTASICYLANIAYQTGQAFKWDPVKEKSDVKAVNKLLAKKYRKPYLLPKV